MKKTVIPFIISLILLFTSCTSTNNTFGVENSINEFVSEYVDEFTDDITVMPSKRTQHFFKEGFDVATTLLLRPYFINTNGNWICRLQMIYPFTNKKIEKIVLMSDASRITLDLNLEYESLVRERPFSATILADVDNNIYGDFLISENQYLLLTDFFTNEKNIQAAVYFIDNTVKKLPEYKTYAKKDYSAMYDYYKTNNLSGKFANMNNISITKR